MTYNEELKRFYFDRIKTTNIETLRNMYSPLFDKKFNEMTDDEIKQQLDVWVVDNTFDDRLGIRKPKTKEQREQDYRNFVKGRK